ncbi:MAG TPA: helix-turn-helix domain-containing protein [Fimbriimonadaceae bacterium]|mgnify:FL=1|nr:helix-turn-helix domain-containing protein [Fimbriimonadaceae bacterium]
MPQDEFDPVAYIEGAFLDAKREAEAAAQDKQVPSMGGYLKVDGKGPTALLDRPASETPRPDERANGKARFRKRELSAPRPRRVKSEKPVATIDPQLQEIWMAVPRNIQFLSSFFDDSVTAHYYRGEFKESRGELIRRLLDPELTLEEVSRLLGVCPATVRRYTNRGWLEHHRTTGGQRRFRLSGVVKFVEVHGRHPEA